MKHWQQHSKSERFDLLRITSEKKGLPLLAIEKDWWVTMTLKALSLTQFASIMSFKGGTSLSKGWNLIKRFSEDIDITIRREGRFAISSTSNNQLTNLRRKVRHYVVRELPNELEDAFKSLGIKDFKIEVEISKDNVAVLSPLRADADPSVVYVNFKTVCPETSQYLLPKVKIEITGLSMDEPVEEKCMKSFISELIDDIEDVDVKFDTVKPERTFLEKIFLLHEEFQREHPRHYRMSRHLYDLKKLMDTAYAKNALADVELYQKIIEHRSIFNRINGVNYESHSPQTVNFLPPENVVDDWEKDYNTLCNSLLYFNEEKISFSQMLLCMQELKSKVSQLSF